MDHIHGEFPQSRANPWGPNMPKYDVYSIVTGFTCSNTHRATTKPFKEQLQVLSFPEVHGNITIFFAKSEFRASEALNMPFALSCRIISCETVDGNYRLFL